MGLGVLRLALQGPAITGGRLDGAKDEDEEGLAGWTIQLLGPGEHGDLVVQDTATTAEDGQYTFSNVGPGTYQVREVQQDGWTQTTADPDDVLVESAATITEVDFGNFQYATIDGQKFHDANGDEVKGDPADEPPLAGWTIYLDANDDQQLNGDETFTVTDRDGNYTFTGLELGSYVLREVQQEGWNQTTDDYPIAIAASGLTFEDQDFGNQPDDQLHGKVLAAVERAEFNAVVAVFAAPNASAGDFTATILWGDGTASAGAVGPSGSSFVVSGSHTYDKDFHYVVAVRVCDTTDERCWVAASYVAVLPLVDDASLQTVQAHSLAYDGAFIDRRDADEQTLDENGSYTIDKAGALAFTLQETVRDDLYDTRTRAQRHPRFHALRQRPEHARRLQPG